MEVRNQKSRKLIIKGIVLVLVLIALLCGYTVKLYLIGGAGRTWNGIGYRIQDHEVTITSYKGRKLDVVFPSKILGKPVTTIGDGNKPKGFIANSIVIPEGVTKIEKRAFEYHSVLKRIEIPDTVTEIGKGAFFFCKNLEEVNLPKNLEVLENGVFMDCWSLKSVTMPENLTRIEGMTFSGCDLESIVLPDNITYIGGYSFQSCGKLREIIIPPSVKEMQGEVFKDSSQLEKIEFQGDWVRGIQKDTFLNTKWLENQRAAEEFIIAGGNLIEYNGTEKKVIVPDTVKAISEKAFQRCENVEEVIIPDSVESIGKDSFTICKNLETIYIGKGAKNIENSTFELGFKLRNIVFKGEVPEDANVSMFYMTDEKQLKDITIYGKDGTRVEEFAKEYGLKFKKLNENGEIPEM